MSYDNPRVKLENTMMETIIAMVEGNPGAVTVVAQLIKINPTVDPDDAFAEWGPLLSLDSLDIYGPRIWMLYKDVCGQHAKTMLAVLRSVQLGFLGERDLNSAIDGKSKLDLPVLIAQVQEQLPDFNMDA